MPMVVPGCKLAAAFAVLVFCSSWETGEKDTGKVLPAELGGGVV